MARINQSFCYPMYRRDDLSLEALLAGAAEIGYPAVEIWGRAGCPFDEIVKLTQKLGLRLASMGGHTGGLSKPDQHERIAEELTESINLAADLNIPGIIGITGNKEGMDPWVGLHNCAEILKRVAPLAEAKGVNINVELLNSKVDHKDFMCDRTLWAVTLCQLVGSPRIKILYDIYHMQIMEGDVIRTIQTYHEYFGHYHTAGNPGRIDPDDQQELYYPAVMRAIAATGYDLFVGHEFRPREGDPLGSLAKAFAICDV